MRTRMRVSRFFTPLEKSFQTRRELFPTWTRRIHVEKFLSIIIAHPFILLFPPVALLFSFPVTHVTTTRFVYIRGIETLNTIFNRFVMTVRFVGQLKSARAFRVGSLRYLHAILAFSCTLQHFFKRYTIVSLYFIRENKYICCLRKIFLL